MRKASYQSVPETPVRFCGVTATVARIGGRWKPNILWSLAGGTQRYKEITKYLKGASPKVLTEQLRALEEDGLIERQVFAEVPPRVEYTLTELGRSLIPVLEAMEEWGLAHREDPSAD